MTTSNELQHILIPLDGSTRAESIIPFVKRIAKNVGSTMHFLYVVDDESYTSGYSSALAINEIQRALFEEKKQARIYLTNVITAYQLQECNIECIVETGAVGPTILKVVAEKHVHLVTLCSHGLTGLKRTLMGSIAQYLTRHCPVPVLVVRDECSVPMSAYPDHSRPLHSAEIIVALDGSEQSEQALLPAMHLISAITSPARGIIHLLCLVPMKDYSQERYLQVNAYAQEKAKQLQTMANDDLSIYVTWSVHVADDIVSAIIHIAEHGIGVMSGGSDLIAMYSHDRNLIERVFFPSVTEHVLGQTKLPLFVV